MIRFLDRILGKPIASSEEEQHRVGVFAGIPMLGLDALASAAYGPEAALTVLLPIGAAGLSSFGPIVAIIVALLGILYISYRQTIQAYPTGGGSYTVANENLGRMPGLFAASSLLIDYVLTAAVGISAGVGALVSAVPSLHPYMVPLCLGILALVTLANLRGVRESGMAFALPTYVFIVFLGGVVLFGVVKAILAHGNPTPVDIPPPLPVATEAATLWLLLRAFASGCTAMTGVEAVSNGVGAFARPTVKYAQRTLTAIVLVLAVLLLGIGYLCSAFHIAATDPTASSYQSVVSQLVAAVVGRGAIYYITIGSVLAVLALSANTGFADFPRLCRILAQDGFLPKAFASRGRRLVFTLGISILAILTGTLLVAFGGITDRLIPLFAVGAFAAFTLSQAGMVVHWRRERKTGWKMKMTVNGLGALATGMALLVILVAKFSEGAWITLLLIPFLVLLFHSINQHYRRVREETTSPHALDVSLIQTPLVIVPLKNWDTIGEKALLFAMTMSPDVIAVHIAMREEDLHPLNLNWQQLVVAPLERAGKPVPQLYAVSSPYRRFFTPFLEFVSKIRAQHPNRPIAVVIPELVESRWYEYLLHNQRASALKAALLFRGDRKTVVVNVPWYLGKE